ncbi:pyridoxamine 5'-phosphate oxidase family protein [Nocardia stercoris]|uniref:Pyridoxamine 5'-phosphate oxidase family protein n=1 Tax=Nocardia stercoris TaxID=2483361 RepID=A0A3M2KT79_9NOCA|nr:pyridoxamine 5'-phosphate oxidase family protein [Nocardia stercoris]RMI27876.1 pyridoxamine 5'-phosphate oxidase family protein [Nocardia stercoris]
MAAIEGQWDRITEVVARARRSTGHLTVASVDPDGMPTVTPIGTVFLRDDHTGYYFDQYTSALTRNLDADPRFCLMAVDSGSLFWLRSLLVGRFVAAPGVRLYGTAGPRRPATDAELGEVRRRVRPALRLRGGRMLWSDFSHVRDLTFTGFRPVRYPVMMDQLWGGVPAD